MAGPLTLPSIRELGFGQFLRSELPTPLRTPRILLPHPEKDFHLLAHRLDHQVGSTDSPTLDQCQEPEFTSTPSTFASPFHTPVSTSCSPTRVESPADRSPRLSRSHRKPALIYSLDVLRLDSSNSSLDHLSSRMTFACDNDETTRIKIADNSPSRSQSPAPTSAPRGVCYCRRSNSLTSPLVSPFPIDSSSARMSVLVDDMHYALKHPVNVRQASEEEYKLRKHVCTICQMRFRRPSGLHTHLNSHTGATPFRCTYPKCGRQFSVKSNMLRHYRSHPPHGISGLPNKNNSRRRKYPSSFVVVDSPIFAKRPITAELVESSQTALSSRADSPLSSDDGSPSSAQLQQVFSWSTES